MGWAREMIPVEYRSQLASWEGQEEDQCSRGFPAPLVQHPLRTAGSWFWTVWSPVTARSASLWYSGLINAFLPIAGFINPSSLQEPRHAIKEQGLQENWGSSLPHLRRLPAGDLAQLSITSPF